MLNNQKQFRHSILFLIVGMLLILTAIGLVPRIAGSYSVAQILMLWVIFVPIMMMIGSFFISGQNFWRMKRPMLHLIRICAGILGLISHFISLFLSPLTYILVFTLTYPIFIGVLSSVILKEKQGYLYWFFVILGFLGLFVMIDPEMPIYHDVAWILPSVSGFFFALFMFATNHMRKTENFASTNFYYGISCVLFACLLISFQWLAPESLVVDINIGGWRPIFWDDLPSIMMIGILAGTGHLLIVQSFRMAKGSLLAALGYLQFPLYVLIGYLALHGWLGWLISPTFSIGSIDSVINGLVGYLGLSNSYIVDRILKNGEITLGQIVGVIAIILSTCGVLYLEQQHEKRKKQANASTT